MDAVMWINVILGITWATLFVYLNSLRKRVWLSRILLHADYLYVANRIYKLHSVWRKMAEVASIYKGYNLSPEDQKSITNLFMEVSNLMEEENGEELIREGRGDQVSVK